MPEPVAATIAAPSFVASSTYPSAFISSLNEILLSSSTRRAVGVSRRSSAILNATSAAAATRTPLSFSASDRFFAVNRSSSFAAPEIVTDLAIDARSPAVTSRGFGIRRGSSAALSRVAAAAHASMATAMRRVTIICVCCQGQMRTAWALTECRDSLLASQRRQWIHLRRAPRRDQAREQPRDEEHDHHAAEHLRIARLHFEQDRRCGLADRRGEQEPERDAEAELPDALTEHHADDLSRLRAERHADSHFLRAPADGERHHRVEADRRQEQRDAAEDHEHRTEDADVPQRTRERLFHRVH